MIIEKDCEKINFSGNINEVIRSVLNFLFFYDKISEAQEELRRIKKDQKALKSIKNTTNLRFINLKFIDIRFINLKFIDIRFINLKLIDIRFIKPKKHLSGKK